MLEYSVEGESITPEEFEAGEWTSVLKAQDRFKKSLYGDNAESTPRETQAGSDGRKALGAEQVKRGRAPVRQKRRPFLKMPAKDFKVVCRPKNWDLSVVTPRELGSAMRAAAKLTSATAAEEDLVRVNETNNTMTELRDRYINGGAGGCLPHYSGEENSVLDEDFTVAEVEFALGQLRTTSAAGPDGVTNKMLRNLDFKSVGALTDLMNKYWVAGEIPAQWKHARIIFIPKPGKKLCIENMRPISLTSCVGKLMEHVVLNRLQGYAEDKEFLPATMLGFRANLSTQDVMIQLKTDVIDPGPYVVPDYFKRVEFQQRGSAHVHVILWLEDAPEDEELSRAEGAMPKTLDCRLCRQTDRSCIRQPPNGFVMSVGKNITNQLEARAA
ncbi:uncharacterized protein LOC119440226 [Dermacentor silvarum]|uniref:uncharacterized protein LOC119440226 n=1 Tax=Dermacentor silvarum TaxID=543639 RepID=UPI0018988259|nr:uncharacterized protein LOC119440226 [Dermacentor silvarum]